MQREIKFRAWNGKEMHHIGDLENIASMGDWRIIDDYTDVMQYTGLTDKNGKEIYEGDLVEHGRLETMPLQVRIGGYWSTEGDCGWGVHVHNEDETFVEGVSAFNQDNNLTVIGNIYENPELLTPTTPTE